MIYFKRIAISALALLLFGAVAAYVWTLIPVTPDRTTPDASLVYANKVNTGGPEYKESYFEFEGRTLHYVEAGEGDVVLFFHGFPSYWYSLIRPMNVLKKNYRVVAIDGLGKGRSDVPTDMGAYKIESMTAHIRALIDHLGADKVHVVGHDWGTGIAFGMAQRYPEKVMSVVGMSAPPGTVLMELVSKSDLHRELFAYIERFKKANPLILLATNIEKRIWEGSYKPLLEAGHITAEEGALFRAEGSNPKRVDAHISWYRANVPRFDEITEDSFWPARRAPVQAPALFIWGKDDKLVTDEAIAELKVITAELELLPVEGVDHRPQFEASEIVAKAIDRFITEHKKSDD